jgi:hypothetical protein
MKKHEDGGPAFPHAHEDYEFQHGMSLRDYFAAAALQGLLANPEASATGSKLAAYAYRNADAMLSERLQERNKS